MNGHFHVFALFIVNYGTEQLHQCAWVKVLETTDCLRRYLPGHLSHTFLTIRQMLWH